MLINCDILIIGAGPAGSTSSKVAANIGGSRPLRVVLLEKRTYPGVPVQCAEYVPWQIVEEIRLQKEVIAQQIDIMKTYMPDGEIKETQSNGFIIHRNLFDQELAREASDAGVKLFLQTIALGYENGLVQARQVEQELQIKAKIIIGADGPYSIVGKWMNMQNTRFIHAAQYQMSLNNRLCSTEIYFRRDIACGYGWVFPKGKIANVGVGVDLRFGIKPVEALNRFVEYLNSKGVIKGEKITMTGGVIPVGGLLPNLWKQDMLLVGDAAGMTHPITGAGVLNAVMCGKIAGEVAARAVLKNNLDILSEYEEECQMILGEPLKKASQKRKEMEKHWDDKDLTGTVRSSWIAFEEYFNLP